MYKLCMYNSQPIDTQYKTRCPCTIYISVRVLLPDTFQAPTAWEYGRKPQLRLFPKRPCGPQPRTGLVP